MVDSRPWKKASTPIIDAIDVHISLIFFSLFFLLAGFAW